MRKGLILINAYTKLPASINQAERLSHAFKTLGVDCEILRNGEIKFSLSEEGKLESTGKEYDFCIYLDKDKYTAHMLELSGLRLFNSRQAVEICDDKMLTHLHLAKAGIKMPQTIGGLLCYSPEEKVSKDWLNFVADKLSFPLIVKESYGSLGKGVYKADDFKELERLAERVKCVPHLFQKFIKESAGKDVRVIVVGGKCLCAMLRQSDDDFRSNIALGGRGTPYEIDEKLRDICEATAKTLNLDYCGIDLLISDGGYLVCEVNSNAFFGGIESVTHADVAKAYAEYVVNAVYGK